MARVIGALVVASTFISSASADCTDWVNVGYFSQHFNAHHDSSTQSAMAAIIHGADAANKGAPYYTMNAKGVAAPSGNTHDYLSWAPYHWPDCNWCGGKGTKYLSPDGNDTSPDADADAPQTNQPDYQTGDSEFDDDSSAWQEDYSDQAAVNITQRRRHRMIRKKREATTAAPQATDNALPDTTSISLPVSVPLAPSKTTTYGVAGTHAPAQAAAKNRKPKGGKKSNDNHKPSKCTPSPAKPMAPSATWTTCPYVVRDGKVNPDVRTLRGPGAINKATQQIIYNAMAFIVSGKDAYVLSLIKAIDVFYLDSRTSMNPNMNYGQVSRGPGPEGKRGTYTGILDGRGNVKAMNAIMLLRALHHPAWTKDQDEKTMKWIADYDHWCTTSDLGVKALSRANNHGSFFAAQMASTKLALGDKTGAKNLIKHFLDNAFQDQIAASGEQPFEAVRTRPFHYRCFNLEALITIAKIGEEVGMPDVWVWKSKYGATIKTAIDWVMKVDPKHEDIQQLVPHVLSAQRAYGDPHGEYAAFMSNAMSNYQNKPFWLYNQSPSPHKASRRSVEMQRDAMPSVPFNCPTIFAMEEETELEDDLYVTCDDVEPFFKTDTPLDDLYADEDIE